MSKTILEMMEPEFAAHRKLRTFHVTLSGILMARLLLAANSGKWAESYAAQSEREARDVCAAYSEYCNSEYQREMEAF